jgi:hypothetical protein
MIRRYLLRLVLVSMAGALIGACGYRFAGDGEFPGGAKQLFVSVLENRSAETGLEVPMTNALIFELTRSRGDAYARDPAAADAVLTGVIRSLRTVTISRQSSQVSLRRRVTAYVDLSLTDREGKTVWKVRRFSAKQEYDVGDDKSGTERNRKEALESLSSKFAEKVIIRLTEAF